MAECGHCSKTVRGIKDHIHAKHGYLFYEMGPDFRYYGYEFLRDNDLLPQNSIKPHWDKIIEERRVEDALHRTKR